MSMTGRVGRQTWRFMACAAHKNDARIGELSVRPAIGPKRTIQRYHYSSQDGSGETSSRRTVTSTSTLGSTLKFTSVVEGKDIPFDEFKGKAVLVVNTASLCGLTPQLKELELVHKRFREVGLVVLGVPSNDFGGQEPWDEERIRDFYSKEFGVTFTLTSKTKVLGPEAHPFYAAVVAQFGPDAGPQWNFHKLLVGPDGSLSGVFGSNLSPLEPDVTEAIEGSLPRGQDGA